MWFSKVWCEVALTLSVLFDDKLMSNRVEDSGYLAGRCAVFKALATVAVIPDLPKAMWIRTAHKFHMRELSFPRRLSVDTQGTTLSSQPQRLPTIELHITLTIPAIKLMAPPTLHQK